MMLGKNVVGKLMSSVLVGVLVIFGGSLSAQSSTVLNNQPQYGLHTIYAGTLESWSTNPKVEGRDGYCSLIARKNQEQIAKLVGSDYRALRGHAIDLIDRGRKDDWRFRKGNRKELDTYIDDIDDGVMDVYSYMMEDSETVLNPEVFSYRSPHRFTLIKYRGNHWVLDPLRGSKSVQTQPLATYLRTTDADHRFLISKNSIALGATQIDKGPAIVYENSLLNSLVRHELDGHIQPLQGSDTNTIKGVVFQKPFQYVNTEGDVLTIAKDTIVRLESIHGPIRPRVFERSLQDKLQLFHSRDRFTTNRSVKKYDGL